MNVMTSPLVCAVAGFYTLWLVVTVINQFNNASKYLGAYGGRALAAVNSLLVIPRWTFFAPQPGVHDFHLLYRTENQVGEKSAFQEVPIRNTNRDISAAVWNHRKRVPKIIFDLALIMGSQVQEYKKNNYKLSLLKISFHYLLLLHIVSTYCRTQVGSNVQFIIVRTEGHICVEEPELVFISDFHRLSAY